MDEKNKLYFGDNLKILREYVPDASVDLIYLDPPFNSSAAQSFSVAPLYELRLGLCRGALRAPAGAHRAPLL
jgi:16S rRNA G966 N2-methylase RsmD